MFPTVELDTPITVSLLIEILSQPFINRDWVVMIKVPGIGLSPISLVGSGKLESTDSTKILVISTIPLFEEHVN